MSPAVRTNPAARMNGTIMEWLQTISPGSTSRVSGETLNQPRVVGDVAGRQVVIAEERPPWQGLVGAPWESYPVARLIYRASAHDWSLEVSAEGDRFRKYTELPSGLLDELLDEIDEDPTFAFWG